MNKIQQRISTKFENTDDFLPFIESIRFPEYKSIMEDTKINLDWPIVALVGPNGTNKSSVLQAISAAPEGRSLAEFWFSTAVDDIDRSFRRGKGGQRFIYEYRFERGKPTAECRKYRGSKPYRGTNVPKALQNKKDPDYWEPTKRVRYDNMREIPKSGFDERISSNRDRWNQIEKEVVYLDFRTELSAFDKFIHHESFNRWSRDATQKRQRAVLKSKTVAKALDGIKLNRREEANVVDPVRDMDDREVEEISRILGKNLVKIRILGHKIFGPTGSTVRLFLDGGEGSHYSEAHAGSGEYAVVRLVDSIRSAKKGSLILLDEPEVSLHPGAQAKLLEFIEREVLENSHQVVFTTHSPAMIRNLPDKAIKVLGFDREQQKVIVVSDGCSSTEAFTHLGQVTAKPDKFRLVVEDELAVELVKAALRRKSPSALSSLDIVPFPGGADGIVQKVLPSLAISGAGNIAILLDGDQEPERSKSDIRDGTIIAKARTAFNENDTKTLDSIWSSFFHQTSPALFLNSDKGNYGENILKCIEWASMHLGTLPWRGMNPEGAIALSEDPSLRSCCSEYGGKEWKDFWAERVTADLHLTDSDMPELGRQIFNHQVACLNKLPSDSAIFDDIAAIVREVLPW